MRRKFLSVVLCVCMMLTMAPFAFATEGGSSGGGGGNSITTLQSQINAITSEGTVTLDKDYTETITINAGKNITLDLNNHNLSSSTGDAIVNKGTLTIKGSGQVSTTANGSAAIANFPDAVANVNGGTYTSSEWYVIKNLGTMTINGAVTVKKPDGSQDTSSLIDNGWYNPSDTVANEPVTAQNDKAKLTIKSGNFKGNSGQKSCSVVKNDDGGILNISGGTFDSTANTGAENATTILNWNVATISGGTFKGSYPLSNGYYDNNNFDIGELTVTGGTFSASRSLFGQNGGAASGGFIKISGGEFTANTLGADFTYTVSISGGTFSAEPTHLADGYVAKKTNNDNFMVVPQSADNAVAQIGDTYYNTLADAVADASTTNPDTIKLLKDTTERLILNGGKEIILDLGGNTLSYTEQTVRVNHGKLTVNGPGAIKEINPNLGAILIKGSTNQGDTNYSVVNVNGDVTLSGWAPLFIDQNSEKAYGVTVNLDGATLNGKRDSSGDLGSGIYVNGSIKDTTNAPAINLKSTTVNSEGQGMYLAGYTTTTVDKDSSVIGSQTGIEIRAGKLNVSGATIIGNGDFSCTPNGNGSTTNGVGIAIAQHTTKLPTEVTISGGTISGKYAVYESNPQNNDATSIGQVKLSITDGNFNGSTAAVYSHDVKSFISGGLFTSDPSDYCVANKTGVASNDSTYPYTVGEKNTESKPATVDSTTVPANTTSTDETVKEVANNISGASVTNNNATEAATKDIANNNTITASTEIEVNGEKKTVTDALSAAMSNGNANKPSESNPVTIVYQTYVDVTVTDAKKDNSNFTELTVDLTPMYRVIATTKSVAENTSTEIKLTGNDANAIQIGEAKDLNVPAQAYEVTLALPSGFANEKDQLSIKHTKSSSVEYYTGTVSEASSSTEDPKPIFVTFTTNGFSPFTIYAASQSVASVNGVIYPSFQAAVDAAQNNDEITLLKGDAVSATMTSSFKTIKVKAGSGITTSIKVTVNGESKTLDNTTTEVTFTYTRPSSGGPGSSGGSISAPTTYAVNVNAATNGAVAADKKTASKGTTVTVTASPSKGYVVDAVKVVDKDGKDVAVTGKDGKYVFTMPASAVTVTGSFKAETPAPVALPFTDVKSGNWFYDAVKYAYAQGLMTGTSATTFAPNGTMNRAMIVTVLYRLEKSPAVTGASKFTDVPAGQWYSDAVAWAAANKIVNGYDETTFGPMNAVTREQMAAILFRYEQVKGLENVTLEENLNRFPDQNKISAYAIPALQWAVGQKIINGNADGTLDPTGTATRAQVAQIFTNLLNQ